MAVRLVDHEVERARQRYVANWRVTPLFMVGVEVNPGANEVGPLVNWVVLTETERRPAVMLGTSSDRIGTPSGRAYFATASKGLGRAFGRPLSGYAGVSHGTFEDDTRPIGGLTLGLSDRWRTRLIHDGRRIHAAAELAIGRHELGLLLVGGEDLGVTWSVAF